MRSDHRDQSPPKRLVASAGPAAPPTPVTTGMDSEEEYMSNMSTDDEIMQEYSGDEASAGEGKASPSLSSPTDPPAPPADLVS